MSQHDQDVNAAFLDFYQCLLGTYIEQRRHVKNNILNEGPLVNHRQGERLLAIMTGLQALMALEAIFSRIAGT